MKKLIGLAVVFLVASSGVATAEGESEGEWKQRFNLNISGSAGNTRRFDLKTGWRARRRSERFRHVIDASYHYGESEGERDKSALTSGIMQDWLVKDATWFAFNSLRYDFDDFRAWRHRASSHLGIGDELKRTETLELLGRVGAGASKQWEPTDHTRYEGLLGVDLDWELTPRQAFNASSYMYPELGDLSDFRLVSKAELTTAIDKARGMDLVCGLEHDYESSAGTEVRNWDLRYYAGLSIAF